MAVHYYDEDDLEVGDAIRCNVVVNHTIVLTDEEKAEARQQALAQYQAEELRKLQDRKRVSQRTKPEQKKHLNSHYLTKTIKARNKFEHAVIEQSKHLRPITKQQIKWAFRECISHFAYRLPKGRTTCMDCGHRWVMNKHRENLHLSSL